MRRAKLAGILAGLGFVLSGTAYAAQPYHCTCKGQDKRFLASTRYCEHQHSAKSCTREQWRETYSKACRQMGCRLAPLR